MVPGLGLWHSWLAVQKQSFRAPRLYCLWWGKILFIVGVLDLDKRRRFATTCCWPSPWLALLKPWTWESGNKSKTWICWYSCGSIYFFVTRLGLDPKLLSGIINSSTGRNWSSECYNPVPGILDNVPSSNNYQGGFGTSLMAKDLGLAQSSATRSSSAIPLGSLAHQLYRLMSAQGYAKKDFSSIYQFLQELENSTAK